MLRILEAVFPAVLVSGIALGLLAWAMPPISSWFHKLWMLLVNAFFYVFAVPWVLIYGVFAFRLVRCPCCESPWPLEFFLVPIECPNCGFNARTLHRAHDF